MFDNLFTVNVTISLDKVTGLYNAICDEPALQSQGKTAEEAKYAFIEAFEKYAEETEDEIESEKMENSNVIFTVT
jgi:predicted RNase H-like HicB family nuclease